MPAKLIFRSEFFRDLEGIIDYLANEAGVDVALRFSEKILSRCKAISNAPGMGVPYGRKSGARKINEGAHKIFYRAIDDKIIILRIWDGRRGKNPTLPR